MKAAPGKSHPATIIFAFKHLFKAHLASVLPKHAMSSCWHTESKFAVCPS